MVIKLTSPIKYGQETISELNFREMKAKDLRKFKASDEAGSLLDLAGNLCGQPPSVIDELSMKDAKAVLKAVGDFLDGGPATGENT